MAISDLIQNHVSAVIAEQNARVESDLGEAMTLQDFDKLERLCVVDVVGLGGPPPAVASMLESRTDGGDPTFVGGMSYDRHPAFEDLPTASDIARWYVDVKRLKQNVGGDAWWLSRDPHSSCYRVATIDRDVQEHVLLDITTEDTKDLLYVTYGYDGLWCEWWQHPIGSTDGDRYWYRDGVEWLADQMIVHEEARWP